MLSCSQNYLMIQNALQNAGNGIFETLNLIFPGEHAPRPRSFGASSAP